MIIFHSKNKILFCKIKKIYISRLPYFITLTHRWYVHPQRLSHFYRLWFISLFTKKCHELLNMCNLDWHGSTTNMFNFITKSYLIAYFKLLLTAYQSTRFHTLGLGPRSFNVIAFRHWLFKMSFLLSIQITQLVCSNFIRN